MLYFRRGRPRSPVRMRLALTRQAMSVLLLSVVLGVAVAGWCCGGVLLLLRFFLLRFVLWAGVDGFCCGGVSFMWSLVLALCRPKQAGADARRVEAPVDEHAVGVEGATQQPYL